VLEPDARVRSCEGESVQTRGAGGLFRWALWTLILGVFIYPLSAGPALALFNRGVIGGRTIDIIYAPLRTLAEHSQIARSFLDWYLIEIWRLNGKKFASPLTHSQFVVPDRTTPD
jgi:hypothetical protein